MTTDQKRKILKRIVAVESDVRRLEQARLEVAASGYASATLASGGGSKSYTRTDVSKITETIAQLKQELKHLRCLLAEQASGSPKPIVQVWY